jgi:hypothetical protein
MARRSTRKGQRRKTRSKRRAYTGLATKTRRRRRYGSRRGRISAVSRRPRATGIVKRRAMGALKEVGWVTAGSAAGLAAMRFVPGGYMGLSSPTLFGLGALGYGIWRNDPKGIYLGYGALFPEIYGRLSRIIIPAAPAG